LERYYGIRIFKKTWQGQFSLREASEKRNCRQLIYGVKKSRKIAEPAAGGSLKNELDLYRPGEKSPAWEWYRYLEPFDRQPFQHWDTAPVLLAMYRSSRAARQGADGCQALDHLLRLLECLRNAGEKRSTRSSRREDEGRNGIGSGLAPVFITIGGPLVGRRPILTDQNG
jgi:hypothetical protein